MKEVMRTKLGCLVVCLVMIAIIFTVIPFSARAADSSIFAAVTNQFIDKASIIDLSVDPPELKHSIQVGGQPFDVAITPDSKRALVSNINDGTISVIDLTVDPPVVSATISVGLTPAGLDINPFGTIAVVGDATSTEISIVDLTIDPPSVIYTVPISYGRPYAVGITLDGQYAIVGSGNSYGGIVSVVDLTTTPPTEIYTINIGKFPIGIGMDPAGKTAVITTIGDNSASIIDLTTSPFSLKATVPVGKNPGSEPDISPDGKYAVVANSDDNTVSIIDLTISPPGVINTLPVGDDPRGVAIIDKDNMALVANRGGNTITQIDLNTLSVIGSFVGEYSPNHIVISEIAINHPPVADAGPDQSVYVGDLVTLDGSGSYDPDGDLLTFNWAFVSLPSDSTAILDNPTSVNPTFTADVPGTYVVSLVVNDGIVDSEPDTVSISTINVAPIADAGADQSVYVGDLVTLDGSNSWDPDGDSLTFSWAFVSIPEASTATLANPTSVNPTFTADVSGTYVVSLVVNDGIVDSEPDTVSISTINVAPIADAGPDQSVYVGDLVTLDGSGSSDPDGDPITFMWAFVSVPEGSTATLSDSTSIYPTFVADVAGIYVVSLVVNDGIVDSEPDRVTISAVTKATAAISKTQELIDKINDLDSEVFKNPNMKKALTNKLNAVIEKIENGEYEEALKKLENDILRKTDGCALTGELDKNDWITDCNAQAVIYPLVLDVIELLEQLI
jgi:YVTN family beta-propeller protein